MPLYIAYKLRPCLGLALQVECEAEAGLEPADTVLLVGEVGTLILSMVIQKWHLLGCKGGFPPLTLTSHQVFEVCWNFLPITQI